MIIIICLLSFCINGSNNFLFDFSLSSSCVSHLCPCSILLSLHSTRHPRLSFFFYCWLHCSLLSVVLFSSLHLPAPFATPVLPFLYLRHLSIQEVEDSRREWWWRWWWTLNPWAVVNILLFILLPILLLLAKWKVVSISKYLRNSISLYGSDWQGEGVRGRIEHRLWGLWDRQINSISLFHHRIGCLCLLYVVLWRRQSWRRTNKRHDEEIPWISASS